MAFSAYNSRFINPTTNATLTGANQPVKGEIQSISFSGITAAEIDVTMLTSTAKTYVLGTMDGGTVEVTAFMTGGAGVNPTLPVSGESSPTAMAVAFGNQDNGNDFVKVAFSAYVVNTAMEATVDSAVQVTYTLRISGAVTITWVNGP